MKKIFYIILSLSLFFCSCSPLSKESYLNQYAQFMDEISNNSEKYSDKDWKEADEKFKNFDDVWYKKFKSEMDLGEKLTTSKYNLQYVYYRNKGGATDIINKYLNKGYEDIKEKVKYYRDNKMDQDLQKLKEASKLAGDSALQMFNKAMEETK
jgi:hypothetical protein